MEHKSKSDTSNNRGKWKHLKIIQTIPGQHSRKALNQGTTKNSHIGHCTHTSESTNVKYKICLTSEITLDIAQTVYREQLQHYTP